jgi:hypothetical protein
MGKIKDLFNKSKKAEASSPTVSTKEETSAAKREEKIVAEESSISAQEIEDQKQLSSLRTKNNLSYGEMLRARQGERQAKVIAARSKESQGEQE